MTDVRAKPPREDQERRCPYCHDDAAPDDVVTCEACAVAHHPTCFSEHGGCSVHGCASREATTGEPPRLSFMDQVRVGAVQGTTAQQVPTLRLWRRSLAGVLECGACHTTCADAPLVARCSACGETQHASCYESSAGCVNEACRLGDFRVDLQDPQVVMWRNRELTGRALRFAGLMFFAPLALWLLVQGVSGGSLAAVAAGLLLAAPAILGQWTLSRLGPAPDPSSAPASSPPPKPSGKEDSPASDG